MGVGRLQPLACGQLKLGQRHSQWFKTDGGRLMWKLDFETIRPACMDEAVLSDASAACYTQPGITRCATDVTQHMA